MLKRFLYARLMQVFWMRRIDIGLDVGNRDGAIKYSENIKSLKRIQNENKKDFGGFISLREVCPMIHRQTRRLM